MKVILFFIFCVLVPLRTENLDKISAKSYILENAKSKKILEQKSITSVLPIASITKLVTALISIHELNENDYYKVHKSSVLRNESDKSAILKKGEYYKLNDLLLTMLVSSTNVSAISLAHDVSGNTEYFVNRMNQWAIDQNLENTMFGDTFGLSSNSISSVQDISRILDLVQANIPLYKILETTKYTIKEKNGKTQNLSTTNEMPFYKDFRIFGKTGTTNIAGKCFAGFVTRGKERWKIVILGSKNVFGDIQILLDTLK